MMHGQRNIKLWLNHQGVSTPGRQSECLDPEHGCINLLRSAGKYITKVRSCILKDFYLLYIIYVISELKFTQLF